MVDIQRIKQRQQERAKKQEVAHLDVAHLSRLSKSQLSCLSAINPGGLYESHLYDGWHVTMRTVASLERRGYIERPYPDDPKFIRLTSKGNEAVLTIAIHEDELFF